MANATRGGARAMVTAVAGAAALLAVASDAMHGLPIAATLVVAAAAWLVWALWGADARRAVSGTLDVRAEDAEARAREITRLGVELDEFDCKVGTDGERPAKGHVVLREHSLSIAAGGQDATDVVFREADIEPSGRLALEVHDGMFQARLEMESARAATKIKDVFDKATGRTYPQ